MNGVTPQPRDKVRVNFDTTAAERSDDPYMVNVIVAGQHGDDRVVSVPTYAVEVLERADDPSKDLTGSIRHTGTITCIARERDGGPDYHRWIAVELNESFTDEHMRGTRVIGAVPGTPAAEENPVPPAIVERVRELLDKGQFERAVQVVRGAVADMSLSAGQAFVEGLRERDASGPRVRVVNEPHGLTGRRRDDLLKYASEGDLNAAAGVLSLHTTMSSEEAIEYVRGMSEYQTYLTRNEKRETCTKDDCPGGTRCSSGTTVWHYRTPACGGES